MKTHRESRGKTLWNRVKADLRMDNAAKARLAGETVQEVVTGLREATDPAGIIRANGASLAGCPAQTVRETRVKPVSAGYEVAEYREAVPEGTGKHHTGRLLILRKKS